jgi:hypothetical protein
LAVYRNGYDLNYGHSESSEEYKKSDSRECKCVEEPGKRGKTGNQGKPGPQGPVGKQGPDGKPGIYNQDGKPGIF